MRNLNHILLKRKIVIFQQVDKVYSKIIFNHIKGNGKKMNHSVKLILFIIGFIFFAAPGIKIFGQGKDNVRYITLPGSKLWIDGSSNIDIFTCKSHYVTGYADIKQGVKLNTPSSGKDTVLVSVLVHSLDCGRDLMNDDMYNAMKADEFPVIKYELLDVNLSSRPDSLKGWFTLDTRGDLYIAGKKNLVNIKMEVEKLPDGNYRLVGSKPLSMLEFGITPPSHFFGLIHAHNELVVHFDLLAARAPNFKAVSSVGDSFVK